MSTINSSLLVWAILFHASFIYSADENTVAKKPPIHHSADNLAKLTLDELMGRLVSKQEDEAKLSQYSSDLLPIDEKSNRPLVETKKEIPETYAVMAELIRRGGSSLSILSDHISDKSNTEFLFGGEDVDFKLAYRLKVGDLCYEMIGLIVNERMKAVDRQGLGFRVINSPVQDAKLAKEIKRKWGSMSEEEHRAHLIEMSSNRVRWMAWHKLHFYYPMSSETIAIQHLRRPIYDQSKLWDFIADVLTAEQDPKQWKITIDKYVKENGDHVASLIPYWMYWIYWETNFERDEAFLAKQKIAKKILEKYYPQFDRRTSSARSKAAELSRHRTAVSTLSSVVSKRIDAEVFKLLKNALEFELSKKEKYKLTFLVEGCLKRLYAQNFHKDGKSDVLFDICKRIIERERSDDPIYEKSDPYNKLLQKRTKDIVSKYEPEKSKKLFAGEND